MCREGPRFKVHTTQNKGGSFMVHRFSFLGIAILAGTLILSGCATHKFVRQEISKITPQIDQANNAIKENAERIDAVDRRATQGITAAQQAADRANAAAQTAQQTAQGAQQAADRNL